MTKYTTFNYNDILPIRVKNITPIHLQVQNNSQDSALLLIIRILSGTIELVHNYSNQCIKSNVNYFSSDYKKFRNWTQQFPQLFSEDIDKNDLASFINHSRFENRTFYSKILSEISQFILHTKRKSHTSAFTYLYRILEKISYAFPLIYTSKTSDFSKSFNSLKDMMGGDSKKRELGFFKVFIDQLYKDKDMDLTSIDIFFNTPNTQVQSQMFKIAESVTATTDIHPASNEPFQLSIKYTAIGSFIINLRNKFFHNLNEGANKNIDSYDIVDSDEFFCSINPPAMHWISMIFLEILIFSLSNHQRYHQ